MYDYHQDRTAILYSKKLFIEPLMGIYIIVCKRLGKVFCANSRRDASRPETLISCNDNKKHTYARINTILWRYVSYTILTEGLSPSPEGLQKKLLPKKLSSCTKRYSSCVK